MKTKFKQLPVEQQLRLLIDHLDDNNDYILLLAQWNNNERDQRMGIISLDNYRMYRARISHAVSSYVDDLSDDDFRKVQEAAELPSASTKSNPSHTTRIEGDNNTVILGNSDSKITVIKDSKNVVSGSSIQAGGNVNIGDNAGQKTAKKTEAGPQTILFLAANPSSEARLNLRTEYSIISGELEGKTGYTFRSKFAVSKIEMNEEIDDLKPAIVHFAGHGTAMDEVKLALEKEGIVLTDDTGLIFHNDDKNGSEVLNAQESERIFNGLKNLVPNLEIVLLNACYSEAQARAISKNNIYTIGTSNKIKDDTAIAFAKGFYRKYAKTNDIKASIHFGIIQANTTMKGAEDAQSLIHLFHNGKEIAL